MKGTQLTAGVVQWSNEALSTVLAWTPPHSPSPWRIFVTTQ